MLLPFKIIAMPAKAILGFVGVVIAALVYAWLFGLLIMATASVFPATSWTLDPFFWSSEMNWGRVFQIVAFITTFFAAYD